MSEPNPQVSRGGLLAQEMSRELRRWRFATISYGTTYYISRIALILTSGIVAAKENLSGGHGAWLVSWVPLLALTVAILTALDTWLKPQQKWRGFMESRDGLTDLIVRWQNGLSADETRADFEKIRTRHREMNVF